VDVYFRVPEGRLKLRINEPGGAELVFYRRANLDGPKVSDYSVEPVAEGLAKTLREALETRCVVDKVRGLWLWQNVRIHLDRVAGVGEFIEFEAVLSPDCDADEGLRRVERLRNAFGIADADLVSVGYADLIAQQGR
jgi:predicted adenylyl cyclase CyaB